MQEVGVEGMRELFLSQQRTLFSHWSFLSYRSVWCERLKLRSEHMTAGDFGIVGYLRASYWHLLKTPCLKAESFSS